MRSRSRHPKELVSVAGMAATCVLPVAATAATSGTIHFIGAIVAPPFGVAYAPVAVDPANVTVQVFDKTGAPAPLRSCRFTCRPIGARSEWTKKSPLEAGQLLPEFRERIAILESKAAV